MKIPFATPGTVLFCAKCRTEITPSVEYSDDGDCDFYWCDICVDYITPKIVIVTRKDSYGKILMEVME